MSHSHTTHPAVQTFSLIEAPLPARLPVPQAPTPRSLQRPLPWPNGPTPPHPPMHSRDEDAGVDGHINQSLPVLAKRRAAEFVKYHGPREGSGQARKEHATVAHAHRAERDSAQRPAPAQLRAGAKC